MNNIPLRKEVIVKLPQHYGKVITVLIFSARERLVNIFCLTAHHVDQTAHLHFSFIFIQFCGESVALEALLPLC